MPVLDTSPFSPTVRALIEPPRLNPLDAGQPNLTAKPTLDALNDDSLFAMSESARSVKDHEAAAGCRAGLWLYHNFLDQSHSVSQDLSDEAGAFWHGIMHRREPDAGNSKYWFRRVGNHEIFPALASDSRELAQTQVATADWDDGARFLIEQKSWDSMAWIDLCSAVLRGKAKCLKLCQQIQLREWELLFEHSFRKALGG